MQRGPAPDPSPTVYVSPAATSSVVDPVGNPPGPVLNLALLSDGEFLAGVGPIGDVETGFEWRLYRGRDNAWRRLAWPPEAIPRSLHPAPSGDLIFAVPLSNALFGRGQAWGLMRSSDGGRSWRQALAGLGDPYVMDLAFSPAFPGPLARAGTDDDDRTLFVVTWYNGVHRSTDAGETWQPMPLDGEGGEPSGGANPYDLAVAVSPNYGGGTDAEAARGDGVPSGGEMVVASFSHGLHRWDPATEAWQTIPLTVTATVEDFEPPAAQLTAGALSFSPNFTDDGTIYLQSGYAGLFRSTDRGETWQPINRRLPLPSPFVADFHLAVVSADEAYVLLPAPARPDRAEGEPGETDETATALRQPSRVLYRTHDGGASWQALRDPPTLGWVSTFILARDEEGQVVLHLGGSRGGVSSYLADALTWD